MSVIEGEVLWTPTEETKAAAQLTRFTDWLAKLGLRFADYRELHAWSVAQPQEFWSAVWRYFDICSDTPYEAVIDEQVLPGAQWFKGARINYAEHVLRAGEGREESPAILALSEVRPLTTMTWGEMSHRVRCLATSMRALGVRPGDRVAAYLPNTPEAIVALLATVAIGAIWSSAAPEFGTAAVIDRFAQIEPKLLFAADGYRFNGKDFDRRQSVNEIIAALPSLSHVVDLAYLDPKTPISGGSPMRLSFHDLWDRLPIAPNDFEFERVGHDHPLWILYSSGTTGLPKAIVHSHVGMLVTHYTVNSLHLDLTPASRVFFYTTTGWMMFNSLVSKLLCGSSVVTYDGSPTAPEPDILWKLAAETRATMFGASPTFVRSMQKLEIEPCQRYDLSALRMILLSGSPAQPETFSWFYAAVKLDLWVASSSGGTDICTAITAPLPTLPVRAGLMQCPALGIDVQAYDSENRPVIGDVGELVLVKPAPCMPLGFWGDADGRRYFDAYFAEIPGVWRHGDFVRINTDLSMNIVGRSDSTLNRHGVRIGTAEIYRCVEQVPGVFDSIVVALERSPGDYYMPLFVQLAPGTELNADLYRTIQDRLRTICSPRHVPDEIHAVRAIPYTLSGKKMEVPVMRILKGLPVEKVASRESMRDPAALDEFIAFQRREGA
jgi:acetoacetyl-CoA synthetase